MYEAEYLCTNYNNFNTYIHIMYISTYFESNKWYCVSHIYIRIYICIIVVYHISARSMEKDRLVVMNVNWNPACWERKEKSEKLATVGLEPSVSD